jgi:acyl dehydratase
MGDDGVLKRLYVQVRTPAIYGDTIWYQGSITEKRREGDRGVVTVRITGTNQVGITTTTGEAQVVLPSRLER